MSGIAWVNERIIDEEEPCLSVQERGFLYGDGLFETVRVYQGRPFVWQRHLARLVAGCERLQMPCPVQLVTEGMDRILGTFGPTDGSLRVTVTRGKVPRGLLAPQGKPTVVITASIGEPYSPDAYERGFKAVTVSFPRNQLSPLVGLKSLNYLENLLGKQEAAAAGADEGIFLNLMGEVTEGTISNVFLVLGDWRIVTPPPESGLLPGITREWIIMLASKLGFSVSEQPVFPQDFLKAREAFLTNSLLEVMPLIALDGVAIGNGAPGPVARALREAYREIAVKQFGR